MKTIQTWKIGNCLDLLPEIPDKSIDMILTDLPYGYTPCKWDKEINLDKLWVQYKRIIKNGGVICLTANQPFTSKLVMSNINMFKYEYIWKKEMGTNFLNAKIQPLRKHENILIFYNPPIKCYNPQMVQGKPYTRATKGTEIRKASNSSTNETIKKPIYSDGMRYPSTIIEILNSNHGSLHETQKPVSLFEYLIKTFTNEGDTVHDSCLGSGTTLEACANLNRNCIGFELLHDWEEHYRKRLRLDNTKLDAWTT